TCAVVRSLAVCAVFGMTAQRREWCTCLAARSRFGGSGFALARRWSAAYNSPSMVHHIVLFKLKPEVTPARVEEMMMNTRMQLLKIPEVLSIKCGKRIDPESPWPFFVAIDFESMDKHEMYREDPVYVKYVEDVIKPNTADSLTLDFEMDPGKDVRFS
ncbi:MAG: Dabb family protein, partial [Verrucomicrobiota bacterium]|nr:Dabb family protein [Verrucomicrobiota bacterium]